MILTHIDTGGHGYLSVSKKDILKFTPELIDKISGYSGHSLKRVYLEEDCDASLFLDALKEKNIGYSVKSGYNIKFKITHNYDPSTFEIKIGDQVELTNGEQATITGQDNKHIYLQRQNFKFYRVSASNPFKYIKRKP